MSVEEQNKPLTHTSEQRCCFRIFLMLVKKRISDRLIMALVGMIKTRAFVIEYIRADSIREIEKRISDSCHSKNYRARFVERNGWCARCESLLEPIAHAQRAYVAIRKTAAKNNICAATQSQQ